MDDLPNFPSIQYYRKFVPNVADKLHPLHALLKNRVKLYSEQAKQKQRHDEQSKACNLKLGDTEVSRVVKFTKWLELKI